MNYIAEINMFYDWLLYNPLPTGAIALWHGLMAINNKAGWADEFTVANLVLQANTGLSRQGLDKARNTLMQKELITYKKGTSNQAGKYKMNRFECKKVGTTVVAGVGADIPECKKVGTGVDTRGAQQESREGHSSSTLNKLNKTKPNETNKDKKIYSLFFETYNEQGIINHKELTSKMKQAIDRALKKDQQEEILGAIKRYGEAFRDSDYQFCKYKMTLDKFLTQGNGYYDWLDEGQKWINYSDFKTKGATYAGADKQSSKKDAGIDIAKQAGILSF